MAVTLTVRTIMLLRKSALLTACCLVLSLQFAAADLGRGATYTWNAPNGGGNWDALAGNTVWSNSRGTPVPWTNGYDAYFSSAYVTDYGGGTANVHAPITVHSITFYGDAYDDDYYVTASSATNTISLTNSPTVISVDPNGGPAEAFIAAVLTGSNGLNKAGGADLELDVNNTYSGPTTVSQGVLSLAATGALPGGIATTGGSGALVLTGGGVVNLAADSFLRSVGTGPNQIAWTGSGGFSAFGRVVRRQSRRRLGPADVGQRQLRAFGQRAGPRLGRG